MFIQRVVLTAAIGKSPQLQAVLEERARQLQAKGQRLGLNRTLVGDGPQFVVTAIHENLAAFQARLQENQQDSTIQPFMDRLSPLLGERAQSSLLEVIIQPPETAFTAKFSQRFALTPAVGKQLEMQQILTDRLTNGPPIISALAATAAGGPQQFAVTVFYANLADADALSAAIRVDPTWPAFTAAISAVSGANPVVDLMEVLVPIQPAEVRELAGAATR